MRRHVWWTGVASRAHALYGASWLRSLSGDVSVTLFPPRTFLGAPELSIDDVRAIIPDGISMTGWDAEAPTPQADHYALLSVGTVGIKPWFAVRRFLGRSRLHVVVTDEGFGSYGNWASRRDAWQRQGVPEPWRTVRTAVVGTAAALLTDRKWLLHEQVNAQWQLNDQIAAEFRRHQRRQQANGDAVFLTQPWPELGVMTEDQYLSHIGQVASACADAGLEFVIHPHPAEPQNRYADWRVHAGQGLAELDAQTVNASVLVGATSTAMLNLAAIHHVPTMRVGFSQLPTLERTHAPRQQTLLRQYLGDVTNPAAWRAKLSELGAAKI